MDQTHIINNEWTTVKSQVLNTFDPRKTNWTQF